MSTALKPLVIDRQKWARGGKNGGPRMLNSEGFMCCLGFLGAACGYTEPELKNRYSPEDTVELTAKNLFPEMMLRENTNKDHCAGLRNQVNASWTKVAVSINDNDQLNDKAREDMLRNHFETIGYELKFEN